MNYLIGDLQGCCDAFERLLATLDFSPSRDRIYLLGDLVNRGPCSLRVLERLAGFGDAATCLLGNHDLHLLAVAHGVRRVHRSDTLDEILASPRREHWLHWLRHQRLAVQEHGWLMVHAGVVPQWSAAQTLALAAEVEAMLQSADLPAFLQVMYGNEPARWNDTLQGADRWRFVVNVLTRIRFCDAEGTLDFKLKESADAAPPHLMPWFDVPGRRTAGTPIAFGHWSTLGVLDRPDLLALDTGCVWGGRLTAARVDGGRREQISVACPQAQAPH
ncbi:symmetrical bis(5'-nucleosyl)-tetraphosphatase [Sphaerotilus montanus]|jgi:bis(5'-nucleosyl)-tetraphosphatase (symmetrical)|uniref:bis(5'-nucleosyl)-tetraphosphatase (symmetrical) n=1 Tax=Sphaerotilus montanus TaxID=522889 RepID=A0A7Y9UI45_9BURK|nr:symmetrical bis(5'-nucleosyl)-tetraphosphatase [Sphaerotilus montanus]NYG31335.1 bis(5'-nucleosyl)-tetraphosphatase (symmetrical) [Sphaerotilus montanus]NZD55317.1 symmetrical bis(5'-nucleosyl)-tetraphosphatase [Sphaerotilus montanus]